MCVYGIVIGTVAHISVSYTIVSYCVSCRVHDDHALSDRQLVVCLLFVLRQCKSVRSHVVFTHAFYWGQLNECITCSCRHCSCT